MKDKTSNGKQRFWVTLGGFAILIAGFSAFSLVPYLKSVHDLKKQISGYQAAISQNQQQTVLLKDLMPKVQLVRMEVANYDRLVPSNQDLGPFLTQLSRELEDAGMKDSPVRALPATVLGKCQQLPIEIKGVGSYAQVHRFLTRLESFERKSSVSRLTLESDVPMSGKVAFEITLSIYNTKPTP